MRKRVTILMAMTAILSGCQARSISNSDYPEDTSYNAANNNMAYRGEIDDFALLVPEDRAVISDQEIANALSNHHSVQAEIGKPLLVVQSGAIAPDADMVTALQRHFPIIPFNGQPPIGDTAGNRVTAISSGATTPMDDRRTEAPTSYARRLRLAAAEGGADHILVYWGMLETARRNEATALLSWVPVVGWAIPDESQEMRIRLKAALIDTASGQWRMLTPSAISDDSLSSTLTRHASDQDQVTLLKQKGYGVSAEQLASAAP